MKDVFKKVITILILMMMLINSSLLAVISIAIDAIEEIIDESKINVLHEINLEKYINFDTESSTGVLLQYDLKTGIEYEEKEKYRPLSSTGIVLNLPEIENEYPESVEVIGKSTKATNGSNTAKDFHFSYDKQIGQLVITAVNIEDEEGNIYSENVDNARDIYTIICYYSSNCYSNRKLERKLEVSGLIQADIATENELIKELEFTKSYEVAENISGLISTDILTTDIYNGYINSNSQNATEYKTEYIENLEIETSIKSLSDEIIIYTNHSFLDREDNVIKTDDIIYKLTKIDKNNVLDILGEDGFLQILDENGKILGEINKDTETGDNGIYEITYNDLNKIVIKISKPVKVGTILLQNNREINERVTNTEINRIQVENIIRCIDNVVKEESEEQTANNTEDEMQQAKEEIQDVEKENIEIEQREIYNYLNTNIIEVKESEVNVDLAIDKKEWTNNVQNEVEMTVKLIVDNIKYKLFKNPIIEIELPNEVEKVILKEASLLYTEGLALENIEVVEKNNNKIIRAELSGMQNKYYDNEMINGAELLIPATIIIKKDIFSTDASIKVNCINNNVREVLVNKEYNVDIISINNQSNEDNKQKIDIENSERNTSIEILSEINATLGEEILQDEQVVYEHEYIRYNIKLRNNSAVKVDNINVVGNIPEGTVYIRNYYAGYYDAGGEDKYKTIEDDTVKEYNENISLDAGGEVELYYWIRVNLLEDSVSQKNIENQIAIFVAEEKVNEYKISNIVKKAKLELKINATEDDAAGNRWIYRFNIKNNTDDDITNAVIDVKLQDEMTYKPTENEINGKTDYSVIETSSGLKINIPVLKANASRIIYIEFKAMRLDDSKINFEVETYASIKGDNTDTYHSNLNKEMIHTFGIEVIQTSEKEGQELEYDEEVEYNFKIKNVSSNEFHILAITISIINYADLNLIPISAEYEYTSIDSFTNEIKTGSGMFDFGNKYVPDGVDPSSIPDLNTIFGIQKGTEINLTLKFKARRS